MSRKRKKAKGPPKAKTSSSGSAKKGGVVGDACDDADCPRVKLSLAKELKEQLVEDWEQARTGVLG